MTLAFTFREREIPNEYQICNLSAIQTELTRLREMKDLIYFLRELFYFLFYLFREQKSHLHFPPHEFPRQFSFFFQFEQHSDGIMTI